jgi:hypothetical protein
MACDEPLHLTVSTIISASSITEDNNNDDAPDCLGTFLKENQEGEDHDENAAPSSIPPPPPPDNAVKIRAYKLNLESAFIDLSRSQRQQLCLGPFEEPPPFLTYSSCSEDSIIQNPSSTSAAIKTAQIFRGITVGRDGTILSENERVTSSNCGNKGKLGERSRQADKIDKANDLAEESVLSGKATDLDEASNMVSVFVVGEYDGIKQLVRNGAKKLREAEGLPDEALLAINIPRAQKQDPFIRSTGVDHFIAINEGPSFSTGKYNVSRSPSPREVHRLGMQLSCGHSMVNVLAYHFTFQNALEGFSRVDRMRHDLCVGHFTCV